MKHIRYGGGALHVADAVSEALENLADALERTGMSATVQFPALDSSGSVVTLVPLTPGDIELGAEALEGFPKWRLKPGRSVRARPAAQGDASHLGMSDLD